MKSFEQVLDEKESFLKRKNNENDIKEYTEGIISFYEGMSSRFPEETEELLYNLSIFKFLEKVSKKNELVKPGEISISYEDLKVKSGTKEMQTMSIHDLMNCLKVEENRRGYYLAVSLLMNPKIYESVLIYLFKVKFPN